MHKTTVLSICTGMGLLDKAFMDVGFNVVPLCEINGEMRGMYKQITGLVPQWASLEEVINELRRSRGLRAELVGLPIIGGPPCQSHSKLKAMRKPKFPDLTPLVNQLFQIINPPWFLLENTVPVDLDYEHRWPGDAAWESVKMDSMHWTNPHQSRPRWYTYGPTHSVRPPDKLYHGTVDSLMAYGIVAGKTYGPVRGAILQGYPGDITELKAPCRVKQLGLANAVTYPVAKAWAERFWWMLFAQEEARKKAVAIA